MAALTAERASDADTLEEEDNRASRAMCVPAGEQPCCGRIAPVP